MYTELSLMAYLLLTSEERGIMSHHSLTPLLVCKKNEVRFPYIRLVSLLSISQADTHFDFIQPFVIRPI